MQFHLSQDFLPQQFGRIIWDYYIKYYHNQINEFQDNQHGKNYGFLSEEDFIKKHGEKPWEIIGEIIDTFDSLEYKIDSPEGTDPFKKYQLRLIHKKINNLEIDYKDLSSGERILMALVASIYKTSSDSHFPGLLLLDEVDTSLHPSMVQNFLDVINNTFLLRGVKVILVTHSPTTIALVPENSIYIMNKGGKNRIEKTTKEKALEILTEGFVTIDEGIKLFDQISRKTLSILTEGKNTEYIQKALDLLGIDIRDSIEIITGAEGNSGKDQLKTLFHFFSRVNHDNKVIFVWDTDVKFKLEDKNNTIPFIFERNNSNTKLRFNS